MSVSTVLQAYRKLEAERRIEARPKSGFYVHAQPRKAAVSLVPSALSGRPVAVESADLIAGILRAVADTDAVPLGAAGTMGTSAPAQLAVTRYLESGAYDRHLRRLRRTLRDNVRRLSAEVIDRFPEGTRVSQPEGVFLLWVELPGTVDTLELHARARDAGISICPGSIFSATGGYRSNLRLSAGHPWSERTERALATLARWA